ncbi:MAG: ABC transporter permease [Candidatus Hadarchaeales archaeon]
MSSRLKGKIGFPKLRIRVEKRPPPPLLTRVMWYVLSVLLSLAIGAILILSAGVNPAVAYYHLFAGALGGKLAVTETLWRFTPLLLTGTAVAVAFTCKFWNIGAEGQMLAGATLAAYFGFTFVGLSPWVLIPLVVIAGFLAGAAWAVIPAILRAKFGVDDVVTTLLGNWIMLYLVGALVEGPWRDPYSLWPESPAIASAARFPTLIPGYRIHIGFIIAIMISLLFFAIIQRSVWGYQLKAVGANPKAAGFAGIDVSRVLITAAVLSGGIAGVAGVNELCGTHFHLKGIAMGAVGELSWGYGYAGVFIAMLGGLHPIGVMLAAFFMAIMINGSQAMYRATGVYSPFWRVMQGVIMICLLIGIFMINYRVRRVRE